MNPYQKIVIDGKEIQTGHIDTIKKFEELTWGVDLKGKSVLDIGCNSGMMCKLAHDAGASFVRGIDIERSYIESARELFPELSFDVRPAHLAVGNYSVAIASAMFHYVKDWAKFMNQLARVSNMLLMDVWVASGDLNAFARTDRGDIYIPTERAFHDIAGQYWGKISENGMATSPDGSRRILYILEEPKARPPRAELIYGPGGSGKTTLARSFFDHKHLQLDQIFVEWCIVNKQFDNMSVMYHADMAANNQVFGARYWGYHRDYLKKWLQASVNLDVVIDGYDMVYEPYRKMIKGIIALEGWAAITDHKLEAR